MMLFTAFALLDESEVDVVDTIDDDGDANEVEAFIECNDVVIGSAVRDADELDDAVLIEVEDMDEDDVVNVVALALVVVVVVVAADDDCLDVTLIFEACVDDEEDVFDENDGAGKTVEMAADDAFDVLVLMEVEDVDAYDEDADVVREPRLPVLVCCAAGDCFEGVRTSLDLGIVPNPL
jgi:hypothetical protein